MTRSITDQPMRTTLAAIAALVPLHAALAQLDGPDHAIGTYILAPASHHTDSALEAIQLTIDRMEAAVLDADQSAYLANVATSDPVFLTEQRNWAKDLDKHIPDLFDISFEPIRVGDDRVEGEMTMRWAMPGAAARDVSYHAGFTRDADAQWRYTGEVWQEVPGEGVVAHCASGLEEVGKTAIEVYPDVRAHIEEGFQLELQGVQQIKVYSSMSHLQASIYLSYVDALAGWNEPHESIKILSRRRPDAGSLRVLLAHEMGHVATFQMGEHASDMPWWVLEGIAELAAERYSGDSAYVDNLVHAWAATGNLAPWDEMADFRETPKKWMMHVYKQSQHLMGFVSDRYGRAARNDWIRAMALGATLEDATKSAFDVTFLELDTQWRTSLKKAD